MIAGDPGFVECQPDFRVSEVTEITPDMLAHLGIKHALIDLDRTLVCPPFRNIDPATLAHIRKLFGERSGITLSIATENEGHPEDLADLIGEEIRVFQPHRVPSGNILFKANPAFYRRILFELDLIDSPGVVVMIGDSPRLDIEPAQKVGIKTIQVDRLDKRINPRFRKH